MNSETPLVCNMNVFTAVERDVHIQNATRLVQAIQNVREIERDYEFRLPGTSQTILQAAEFISNERRCCPFLEFTLQVSSGEEPLILVLTGSVGTPEFLRMEFEGAFQ